MNYEKRPVNIEGWGMYQVDTDGNVYSKSDKIMKYSINHNGYCILNFSSKGKSKGFAIHTIVAKTFLSNNDKNKNQVNHKDGNKQNNNVDNLEWVTAKENTQHSVNTLGNNKIGINNPNSKRIYGYDNKTKELKYKFDSVADAAKYFVSNGKNFRYIQNIICQVANNKNKKSYKGCVWKYT